jgi:hypothetical protein
VKSHRRSLIEKLEARNTPNAIGFRARVVE